MARPDYDWSSAGQLMHTVQDYLGFGQENDRIYNSEEAQKQRDWEEKMANTAHQREVEDLKKAGLNPVLSATGGSGAATPTGNSASSHASSSNGLMAISSVINSSSNLLRTKQAGMNKQTTEEMYNKNGELIGTAVKLAKMLV